MKRKEADTTSLNTPEMLPQNIQLVGEPTLTDHIIYIHKDAYRSIHSYSKNKKKNESGGFLIGRTIDEFSKIHIIIESYIEAKYSQATPMTLTFTHETWDYVYKIKEKEYANKKIVGWFHTHPDFGIFLSEHDNFIQKNFFREENQIAYVIDPIREEEGIYIWKDQRLEKCSGFYIYGEVGEIIDTGLNEKLVIKDQVQKDTSNTALYKVMTLISITIAIISLIMAVQAGTKVKSLELDLQIMAGQINNAFSIISNQINESEKRMLNLENDSETKTEESSENVD